MGCDIHAYVEFRREKTDGDIIKLEWKDANYYTLNHYRSKGQPRYEAVNVVRGRDYCLFGVLANVRNYNDFEFISEPKGMPKDCCNEIRRGKRRWGSDGHSHSYLTLKELIDFKASHAEMVYSGFVSPEDAEKLDAGTGTPRMWCEMTTNEKWSKRTWKVLFTVLDDLIITLEERKREFLYSRQGEDDNNIRIVFWFDN